MCQQNTAPAKTKKKIAATIFLQKVREKIHAAKAASVNTENVSAEKKADPPNKYKQTENASRNTIIS